MFLNFEMQFFFGGGGRITTVPFFFLEMVTLITIYHFSILGNYLKV